MIESNQRQDRSRALGRLLPTDLGASAAALKHSPDQRDPGAERLHAMLEVAYLAAAADDVLTDEEISFLVANIQSWLGEQLDSAFLVKLFEHLAQQLATDGFAGRLAAVAAILDHESRRTAYKLACVTALCDHDVHDDELQFLGGIVDAFGLPVAEAQAIFDELDEALTQSS
jgi:tellurite resistance protein